MLKTVKKHPVIVMAMICVASQSSALSETAKNTWDSVSGTSRYQERNIPSSVKPDLSTLGYSL